MIFTAVEQNLGPLKIARPANILLDAKDSDQMALASQLKLYIESHGLADVDLVGLKEFRSGILQVSGTCISLLGCGSDTELYQDPERFEILKSVFASEQTILWVMDSQTDERGPVSGVINGLTRALGNEDPSLRVTALKLTSQGLDIRRRAIFEIYERLLKAEAGGLKPEPEYEEEDGALKIGRLDVSNSIQDHLLAQLAPTRQEQRKIGQLPPFEAVINSPGILDSLEIRKCEISSQALGDDQIEVEVAAVGLSRYDALAAQGQLDGPSVLGLECAGRVIRSGKDADFAVGDRVAVFCAGALRSHARVHSQFAVHVPSSISFGFAALLPLSFGLA